MAFIGGKMSPSNAKKPRRVTGVIFDLDGTILDTMEQWDTLGLKYLQEYNIEPKQDFLDRIGTMTLRESAEVFQKEYGVRMDVSEIIRELLERLHHLYAHEAKIKPGALDTLRLLKRKGVDMAIATATSNELARDGLRVTNALDFFDGIFSCRDPEIRESKRSPKVFDHARQFLGSPLDETIIVEDALYAIETAKKAGYFVIAIEDQAERTRKDSIKAIADVYVRDHAELYQWILENLQE
jgi:HAD superfamily hydrolase (TIGR01509 family)